MCRFLGTFTRDAIYFFGSLDYQSYLNMFEQRVERHLKCIDRGGEYFKNALSMCIFAKFPINVHDVVLRFSRAPRFLSIS